MGRGVACVVARRANWGACTDTRACCGRTAKRAPGHVHTTRCQSFSVWGVRARRRGESAGRCVSCATHAKVLLISDPQVC